MKLYKRVNRLMFLRKVPKRIQKCIKWALGLKPGDLINDCSGFNVVVKEVNPVLIETKNGWYICDVEFGTEPSGTCSLTSCGVERPLTCEEIERRFKGFYDEYIPHGGWDIKTENDKTWMRMSKGLPICDNRGMKVENG